MLRTSAVQSLGQQDHRHRPDGHRHARCTNCASTSRPSLRCVETQTYLLLPPRKAAADDRQRRRVTRQPREHVTTVVPDETLLFQYSALGFNSHRIHIDRDHAREVEGFPDLVVNGGLATLLLTEFLRRDLGVRAGGAEGAPSRAAVLQPTRSRSPPIGSASAGV